MAVPFSNTKLRVPKGFQNILEGLAREILRSQPENAFDFGSKYFEQLLKVREETGHDPAVHGARLEDRFYNNDSFKNPSVDPGSPQQQDAALKIQTNYRKHAAEQEVAEMKEEDAAEKIQAGFKGYQDRQKFQDIKSPEKKDAEKEEEVDIDLTDPDVEKAAVKIQAGFKGFKARQEIKEVKDQKGKSSSPEPAPKQAEEEEVDIDLTDPDVNNAALKIQAGFRGHKTRQEVASMKANKSAEKAATDTKEATDDKADTKETTDDKADTKEASDDDDVDLDLNDKELAEAALKIQTGFRGHLARKEVESLKPEDRPASNLGSVDPKVPGNTQEEEEEVDIDLKDPEVASAALKIQSGFRSHMLRKGNKDKKPSDIPAANTQTPQRVSETPSPQRAQPEEEEEVDIDLKDPEVASAALKIQSGFRSHMLRKGNKLEKETSQVQSEQDATESKDEVAENKDEVAESKDEVTESKDEVAESKGEVTESKDEVTDNKNEATEETKAEAPDNKDETAESKEEVSESKDEKTDNKPEATEGTDVTTDKKEEEKTDDTPKATEGESTEQATDAKPEPTGDTTETSDKADAEDDDKIDLNDPEQAGAALKIQSGFRGFQARKETKASKEADQKTEEVKKEEPKEESKEDVDIDLNDPDVENAALKIQAGFKGMKARQEVQALKESKSEDGKIEEEKKEEVDIDLKDPETEKAALKIQAGFKGYQTRKELKEKKEGGTEGEAEAVVEKTEGEAEKKEEVDIDLNDPDTEKAALKIQAGFKGYQTRKELKEKKVESGIGTDEAPPAEDKPAEGEKTEEESKTEGEKVDIDLDDPEVAKAATKIQAGFKGYKTRQEFQQKKDAKDKADNDG